MNIIKQIIKRFDDMRDTRIDADARGTAARVAVKPAPLLMALEPRVVYDASVAAATPHAHVHGAEAQAHASAASAGDATVHAAPKTIAEHDVRHTKPADGSPAKTAKPASTSTNASTSTTDPQTTTQTQSTKQTDSPVADAIAAPASVAASHTVVFIDPSVTDYQSLIAGLPAGTQYVVLNADSDGFAQIAQYLQTHQGVQSVQLISHGSDNEIQAGAAWLNSSNISEYSGDLAAIGAAMAPGGDFLIYGCDVAENADGKALVQQVAALTHLNVAASTDLTGSSDVGGNWTLEYQVGDVHSALQLSTATEQAYDHVLSVMVETYTSTDATSHVDQVSAVTSITIDGLIYSFKDASGNPLAVPAYVGTDYYLQTLADEGGTGNALIINNNTPGLASVVITRVGNKAFNFQSIDVDIISDAGADGTVTFTADNNTADAVTLDTENLYTAATIELSSQHTSFADARSITISGGDLLPTLGHLVYSDVGPVLTVDTGSVAATGTDNGVATSVAVDPGLTLTDSTSGTVQSATVTIGNLQSGDILSFNNTSSTTYGNITATYNTGTGTLTLNSSGNTATLAQWQSALDAVTFTNVLQTPNTTTRTVTFSVTDALNMNDTASRTVTVAVTDQTPRMSTSGGTTSYTAGAAATAIDSGVSVSDLDNSTEASATVTISSGLGSGDTLVFLNNASTMGNITASAYNATTHAITLTSAGDTATLAQWQAALDSVKFSSSASTTGGSRTISFSISDGTKTSVAATKTLVVVALPVVTVDGGSAAFVTGDNTTSTPVAVDPGVTITDAGHTTLSTATLQITSGYQSGDVLWFTPSSSTGDIGVSYSGGLMQLSSPSGTATIAQWQIALRSITFSNSAVTPSTATRVVSFTINDGTSNSLTVTRSITVTDTDQTPLLTTSSGTTSFVEADGATSTPVVVDSGITVTDADNTTLASATVAITGNLHSGEDVLAFTNTNATNFGNITAAYNSATGVMTLTSSGATATLAQWSAALQAVTYTDTAVTPNTATRTISFTVNDGQKDSAAGTKQVQVSATDQTPVLSPSVTGTVSYLAGATAVTIDSGLGVADADSTTLYGATVQIGSGFHNGDELQLNYNPATMGNAAISYNASTGILTVSATSGITRAQMATLLDSVQFSTSSGAALGTRTLSVTVSDGTKTSAAVAYNIDVTSSAPVLTASGGSAAFTSGDNAPSTPVAVDSGLTVSDPVSPALASATVSITGNFHAGEDVLSFTNDGLTMGDITASYNAGTGVLTLNSSSQTATLAQWQAALREVTYVDTAVTPNTATRTLSFAVDDGMQSSTTVTRTVTVADTDQTPVLTTSGGSAAFVAGDNVASTPVAIDSGLTVSDLDNTTLAAATVSISGNFHPGEDVLSFINTSSTSFGNITASYNAATGVLTLSSAGATASITQWQAALGAVTYTDTAVTPNTATRTLSFSVNDGTKNSAAGTRTVTVTDTDQTPILTGTTSGFTYLTGAAAQNIDTGITVSDLDNTTLTTATVRISSGFQIGDELLVNYNPATMGNATISYNGATGTFTVTSTGGITLAQMATLLDSVQFSTSVGAPLGTRTLSVTVSDGTKSSAAISYDIDVVSSAPVVTVSGGSAAFTAGDNVASTPVAVDGGLTVSDAASTTLAVATVSISGNFHAGEDILSFVNDGVTNGNIVASYDATTGVLTLTSAGAMATLAQWQAALRAVTYTDTAVTPDSSTRTVSFVLSDGMQTSTTATRAVTVADTDQTPIVATSSGSAAFVSGDNSVSTPVTIDAGVAVSDLDNTTLASATVSISDNFHAGEDVLSFTNSSAASFGNITATYDAATGVLSLSSAGGTATLAQWQAALSAVTYIDTAISPDTATRTVSFTVNDGTKDSTVSTRTVTVTATDQTPVLSASTSGTDYLSGGAPVTIDSGLTVSDLDSPTLTTATVQITAGFHAGDALTYAYNPATMGTATISYDSAIGTLIFSSAGVTQAQMQAFLDSVQFSTTAGSALDTRTLSVSVSDGTKSSAAATYDIGVLGSAPSLSTTSTGSAAFVAGDNTAGMPVIVDGGVSVADPLGNPLTSATVAITGNYHAGEDALSFTNDGATMGDIVASFNAATGVLTLTSASGASNAQWDAALRSVTYSDSAVTPDIATRQISIGISDGVQSSAVLARSVTVADVDQTPLVSTSSGDAAFVSHGSAASTPVAVDTGITVVDLDNPTLASATVAITSGFHAGEDQLGFTNNDAASFGNITASYDAATGVMTLTSAGSTATLAQWQAALRAVTYADTAAAPDITQRTVGFTINDGSKSSALGTKTIDVSVIPQTTRQPNPPTPITLPSRSPFVGSGNAASANATPPSFGNAPDTIATFPMNLGDSISNPLIVLDAFAPTSDIGTIPAIHTATFSADSFGDIGGAGNGTGGAHRYGSLSQTSVEKLQAIPAPAFMPLALDLPNLAVHLDLAPNQPFSVSLPVMLGGAEGLPAGADAHVELRLADGRPLPGWLHYDPVRGTLSGRVPANQPTLAIAIIATDAAGHQTRREVAIGFGAAHDAAHGAQRAPLRSAPGAASPHAAVTPVAPAKPSLAEQFARAHASLHVARPTLAHAATLTHAVETNGRSTV